MRKKVKGNFDLLGIVATEVMLSGVKNASTLWVCRKPVTYLSQVDFSSLAEDMVGKLVADFEFPFVYLWLKVDILISLTLISIVDLVAHKGLLQVQDIWITI